MEIAQQHVPGSMTGQGALAQARARFNAFGTAASISPAATSALPQASAMPASAGTMSTASAARAAAPVAETQQQQEARITSELASVMIRLPRHPSTHAVLTAFAKAMQHPGLSKDTISRLSEFQNQLLDAYKQSMSVVMNMNQ